MPVFSSIAVACLLWMRGEFGNGASAAAHDGTPANVIVCGIQRSFRLAEPFRPEPWWPVGAGMLRQLGRDQIVTYGKDVPAIVADIERQLTGGGYSSVARLEIWTHGGPGYFRIESRRCYVELFDEQRAKPADVAALRRLRELLTRDAIVHVRSCSTFHGMKGHAIATTASRFFCATGKSVTVMGHTRPTGLTHPGWKIVRPGGMPHWSLSDGDFEAEFEGNIILIRDLLRVFTAYLYEILPVMYESDSPWLRRLIRDRQWSSLAAVQIRLM